MGEALPKLAILYWKGTENSTRIPKFVYTKSLGGFGSFHKKRPCAVRRAEGKGRKAEIALFRPGRTVFVPPETYINYGRRGAFLEVIFT